MKRLPNVVRQRRRTVTDAAIVFSIIVLIVQMWLLTATLEASLAGNTGAAIPGLLVSVLLFLACYALNRFVERNDRNQ